MQFSRRRIGAFARVVGSNAAEYFDPVVAGYDGYRDVIAPAVFAVVPGQLQQNELLTEVAPGSLPLLHGIHITMSRPVVAGSHLQTTTVVTQQRKSGTISALTTETELTEEANQPIAIVTQKLALLSNQQYSLSTLEPSSPRLGPVSQFTTFELELSQRDLNDYATVSDDLNPIHIDDKYAKQFGYCAPLAQGMLMLGRAISLIERELNHYVIPLQIQARFIAPVEVPAEGAVVIVQYEPKATDAGLTFYRNNQRIARATVTI